MRRIALNHGLDLQQKKHSTSYIMMKFGYSGTIGDCNDFRSRTKVVNNAGVQHPYTICQNHAH